MSFLQGVLRGFKSYFKEFWSFVINKPLKFVFMLGVILTTSLTAPAILNLLSVVTLIEGFMKTGHSLFNINYFNNRSHLQ
jgi:hypothetical protein